MNTKPSPQHVVFKSLIGSHIYGLNTAESDKDYFVAFVAPTSEVAGLEWQSSSNTWSNTKPGTQDDETYYEIAHLFRQMLGGNPNVLEYIYSPLKSVNNMDLTIWLEENVNTIYGTQIVREKMIGFIIGKIRELEAFDKYNYKSVRTVLLKSAGIKLWLQTGVYRFDLFDSQLTDYVQNAPKEDMISLLESECYYLENIKANKFLFSHPDKHLVQDKLKEIRKDYF
jgi:predicted nucleotidyltransferase